MQIAPEPVGFDLRGRCPEPALGTPGSQAVAIVRSGSLHERAEERIDPESVREVLAPPVALVGDPGELGDADGFVFSDLNQAGLREKPARG
jgi:hypothetical protein